MIRNIYVAEDHVVVTISGSIYVKEAADLCASLIDYIETGHKKTFSISAPSNISTVPGWGHSLPSPKELCEPATM